jgi:hypothetical protein
MPAERIKLKVEVPRIEIALGSISDSHPGPGPYVAVAMLHLPEGEAMYQPLVPKTGREESPHLDTEAAAGFLAEIYDFICKRWGS